MSELRFDPTIEQYVVFAPGRLNRPYAFRGSPPVSMDLENPFAVGNEAKTPGESFAIREKGTLPDTPGWEVRAFPNLYPAFEVDSKILEEPHPLYESYAGKGGHEVIVETPDPTLSFEKIPVESLVHYFQAIRDRFRHWRGVEGIRSTYVFKNCGGVAGASLPHSHSQFVALPIVPTSLKRRNEFLKSYLLTHQKSYLDGLIETELQQKKRIVWESESIVAFCPYVSRFPYEVIFYPRQPLPDFIVTSEKVYGELAQAVRSVFAGIEKSTRPQFPYNLFLNQVPVEESGDPWFRWSLEIFPRVGGIAGFEMGTGMWMNSVLPEMAAEKIRNFQS